MKLNRTGNALNRETRNNDNENWTKLEKEHDDIWAKIEKKHSSVGSRPLRRFNSGAVNVDTENPITIYKRDVPCVVDSLELTAKSEHALENLEIQIFSKDDGSDDYSSTVQIDGDNWARLSDVQGFSEDAGGVKPCTIKNVVNYTSSLFDVSLYSTDEHRYKIRLKNKLYFPKGLIIRVKSLEGRSSYAINLLGRDLS